MYINKLLKVDQTLNENYKYLSRKLDKEYDTKNLLQAKKNLETNMKWRTWAGFLIMSVMSAIIAFLIYKHYKNKRLFKEIMLEKSTTEKVVCTSQKEIDLELNSELVETLVAQLERFEQKKKYLEKDMNLQKLATYLKTNSKYASKIVAKYRGKKIIEYISDLKIDHTVHLLKTENKFRNYTNKALGEESGFGSTQNFTKAFKSRTGISPTYFIQELKKSYPL